MALRRADFNDAEQETAYNLIPPEVPQAPKPALYVSKHKVLPPPTASTFSAQPNIAGHTHHPNPAGSSAASLVRTMGPPPNSSKPDPQKVMKKYARAKPVLSLSEVRQHHPQRLVLSKTPRSRLKPGLPTEKPLYNLKTDKNFITVNAIDAILGVNTKRSPTADSEMDYLQKPDYGRIPAYLEEIRRSIEKQCDYISQLKQRAQAKGSGKDSVDQTSETHHPSESSMRLLSEEERLKAVEGLKFQWESLNKQYQGSTHMTKLDTIGKVRRKEYFENTLSQIEKDLEKLSKRYIYVNTTA